MIKLEHFIQATRSQRAEAHVSVTSDRTSTRTRTGRLARWIGSLRTTRNRATARGFLGALRSTYGSDIADIVSSSDELGSALKRGTPLKARHVVESVDHADRLSTDFRRANARIADSFSKPINRSGTTRLQVKIKHEAHRMQLGWGTHGVASLVEEDHVARRLQQQLTTFSEGGKRLVTTADANRILDTVVRAAVNAAYTSARGGAVKERVLHDGTAPALGKDVSTPGDRLEPGPAQSAPSGQRFE